jgi:hypothetical protein
MTEPTKNGVVIAAVRDARQLREAPSGASHSVTPMDLLRIATSQGADLERLEKLMALQQQWEAAEARKAYAAAFAAFKAAPPQIVKNKHVQFATKSGDRMDYWHATHNEVCGKVAAALAPHGLSHSWRTRQEGELIYVTCRLTHAAGHSEEFEMFGNPDMSGLKSKLQGVASTVTFLQRYTLLGACGLSSEEMAEADNDAGKRPTEPEPEGYTEWRDTIDTVPDDQLHHFDFDSHWRGTTPAIRRYCTKFDEQFWQEKRRRAETLRKEQA